MLGRSSSGDGDRMYIFALQIGVFGFLFEESVCAKCGVVRCAVKVKLSS